MIVASTESVGGRIALGTGHVAGMIDLVALPVWVATLIEQYRFAPSQAGGLVTLYLVGVVIASLLLAPHFHRVSRRIVVPVGFALGAVAFVILAFTGDFALMALLHFVAGVCVGAGLSFVHGTIGHSANPHRLFAIVNFALGIFAVAFLGAVPTLVATKGGAALFVVVAAVFGIAAMVTALAFPGATASTLRKETDGRQIQPIAPPVWYAIGGVVVMALIQATMYSFVQRIGVDRGFGQEKVIGVLVILGLVNITPAIFAALLEKRLSAKNVAMVGPLAQAILAVMISASTGFYFYSFAAIFLSFVMLFTHTFVFGWIARMETTGRAVASTPAMLMTGAAAGPFLGGVLVQSFGYPALGICTAGLAVLGIICFGMAGRRFALQAAE